MSEHMVVDIETDGADMLTVAGVVWQGEPHSFATADVPAWVWENLADPNIITVGQSKFDAVFLRRAGYEVAGPYHDTMVMAWCLNENQYLDLGFLTKRYLGYDPDKRLRRAGGEVWFVMDDGLEVLLRHAPIDQLVAYNKRDIIATEQLYLRFLEDLAEVDRLDYFLDEMVPFTSVLIDMEVAGMPIDVARTEALRDELEPLAAAGRAQLYADAGLPESFNIGSGDQLAAYMFSMLVRVQTSLEYDPVVIECIKSCQSGEHEDCWRDAIDVPAASSGFEVAERLPFHIVDLLPEGFVIESIGRTKVHGYFPVKGRNLSSAVVPLTESGSRPMVNTPTLMSHFATDPWVLSLIEWRKLDKLLTTYLRKFPTLAVNERGETYDEAVCRVRDGVHGPSGQDCPPEVLQQAVRGSLSPVGVRDDEQEDWQAVRIRGDAGAPESGRERSGAGTHGGARAEARPVPAAGGSGASPGRGWAEQRPEQSAGGASGGEPLAPAALPELGTFRIFGRFNQTGTKTGRLSSSEPNLQNVPARGDLGHAVRALFRGDLLVGDYSQLEPRLMAHFSQDPVLLDVYRNERDIYLVTALALFGHEVDKDSPERGIAKTVFLGTQYGAGPRKLAQILALNGYPTDVSTAKAYLRELENLYRVAYAWKDDVISFARDRGYVETIGGGRRRLRYQFKDRSNYKALGYGERQAVNAVVQGSAGDIVRKAMVNISRLWPELTLIAQVHDELVWEHNGYHVDLANISKVATDDHGYDLTVPLVFEPHFGPSWADAKEGTTPIELPDEDSDDDE